MGEILYTDEGEGADLRQLLCVALGIPKTATSIEAIFVNGQPVRVRCEFVAVSGEDAEDDPEQPARPAGHGTLDD